ncbi:MAG: hypothetical protein M3460_17980 [Actinomycetota bacterium]|nr:hypothetical protein [Actinomycetota bacterium]
MVGVVLLACVLAIFTGIAAGRSRSTTATIGSADSPTLRLAGQHTFAAVALGARTSWELSRESDDDEDQVVDKATGATVTFDLPAVDSETTTYTLRASSGTGTGMRRVTVFPADTVTRLDGAPDLRTYAVIPSTLSPATHVLLVLHGKGRDAEQYCASWVDWAAEADYLVLCPEFDEDDWPGSAGYNLGNVFADDGGGEVNPEEQWAFTAAEQVHRFAASGFGLDDTLFDMWGHSAGAQFVQRFVLFKPRSAVRFAIAANAGWYTTVDPAIDIPYGVRHPKVDVAPSATREHLVLMRGQLDTEHDGSLRADPQANAQGPHRYARAGHAYAVALARDPETNWQLLDVPGAGHDQQLMAPAAQRFLIDTNSALPRSCPLPDADPCP